MPNPYVSGLFSLSADIRFHHLNGPELDAEIASLAERFGHDADAVRTDLNERVDLDREMLDAERADLND
jgi:hypothetical protein